MSRTRIAGALVALAALIIAGPALGARVQTAQLEPQVDALFADCTQPGSPGAAVVLIDGGHVVLERCYGLADLEHGVPIGPATRFELASVSKAFTAFAAMLLEQEGRLSLTDPIQKHLPELPDYGAPIAIADLLHHTSGLSDWIKVQAYAGRSGALEAGIETLLEVVARQRQLEFAPGTRFSYSNTNYALLAEIVARVAGRPFGDWMQENVFALLDMRETVFPAAGADLIPNRAQAYRRAAGGGYQRSLVEDFSIPGPAHAFSTSRDMARWLDNLRTGRLGGRALIERMRVKTTLKTGELSFYAAGLGVSEYRGTATAGHSGQTGAFKTELLYCPDLGVGVAVLANAHWLRPDKLARRVLDLYLGDELAPPAAVEPAASATPAAAFAMDAAEYGRFTGGYRLDGDPTVLVGVAAEGDWLAGVFLGEGLDLFRPVGPGEFEGRAGNCRLLFPGEGDAAAPAQRLRISLRGEEMWATRVPLPPDGAWLGECLGAYYSPELLAGYEIHQGPEGLTVRMGLAGSRMLCPADADVLVGAVGVLSFERGADGAILGFDFSEPEDLGARRVRFERCRQGG